MRELEEDTELKRGREAAPADGPGQMPGQTEYTEMPEQKKTPAFVVSGEEQEGRETAGAGWPRKAGGLSGAKEPQEADWQNGTERQGRAQAGGARQPQGADQASEVEQTGRRAFAELSKTAQSRRTARPHGGKILRPSDAYLIAFLVPVLIMVLIFVERGIFPFGEESFLRTDMYHQYAPFFSEFQHKLRSGGSLLYSWDVGLGVNFAALYAYYLASPLNFLIILCPKGLIIEFMTYMIVLKIGLAGLSMCYYLRRHCGTYDVGCAFFGIFYALSGYMAAYSWNIMWLDCILLFPLIVLGLERLVRQNRPFLYTVTLGLSILSNYYISIMICIFLVIYFFCILILDAGRRATGVSGQGGFSVRPGIPGQGGFDRQAGTPEPGNFRGQVAIPGQGGFSEQADTTYGQNRLNGQTPFSGRSTFNGTKPFAAFLQKAWRFALFSLLAGGMAAVTLLPEIFALKATASGDFNFPKTFTQYFTIFDMIARHIGNVETEIGLDHWPNIYCGVAVLMLFVLYLVNRRIPIREKAVYTVLLVFFYLSFSVNVLNFIWHGFHYPNSLPCRQSFIYIFLVLYLGYQAYANLRFVDMRWVNLAFALAAGYVLLAQKLITDAAFHFIVFYAALAFLALYYLFIYLWKRRRAGYNVVVMGLMLLVTVEAAVNTTVTSVTTTSRTAYTADNADVIKLTEDTQARDQGFYRFEKVERKTKDDGAWMNFPSVSIFSSMAYAHCSEFFKRIGCESSTNAYSITGSTPLADMLFGVKYAFYDETPEAFVQRGLTFVDSAGQTLLYQNRYALAPGFMLTDDQLADWLVDLGTPALVQNSLCDALETNPVLLSVLGTPGGDNYDFTADEAGEYYVYVSNPKVKKVTVNYETTAKSFDNVDRGYFLELGWLEAGEFVNLRSDTDGADMECEVYRFNYAALGSVYERLSSHELNVTHWDDTEVTGTIDAGEGGVMATSIPYDPGWSVWVDGVQLETQEVLDCFVGVRLAEGMHEVTLRYFPQGLKEGALLSAAAVIAVLGLWLWYRRRRR